MKELTIEEKAKAYDIAFDKIKRLLGTGSSCSREELEYVFPELKESEDERIRKEFICFLETEIPQCNARDKYVAWLEKQGSQDNDEDVDILYRFSFYSYKDEPNIIYLSGLYVNEEYRNKGIGTKILEVVDEVAKSLYCHAIRLKAKKDSDAERLYQTHGYNSLSTEEKDDIWLEKLGEQETLCDKCRKEHPSHSCQDITELGRCAVEHEQKPTEWSEEDKEIVKALNDYVKNLDILFSEIRIGDKDILSKEFREKVQLWLKFIKDRVQPKQQWSKEDERIKNNLLSELTNLSVRKLIEKETEKKYANWLKSLRPHSTWKPSDEMLEALYRVIPENTMEISEDEMLLDKLYQGLKYGRVLSEK